MSTIVQTNADQAKASLAIEVGLVDYWEPRPRRGKAPQLGLLDIWDVQPPVTSGVTVPTALSTPWTDTWDNFLTTASSEAAFPTLVFEEVERLPRFDPSAGENPFIIVPPPRVEIVAERRARWLLSLLEVAEPQR